MPIPLFLTSPFPLTSQGHFPSNCNGFSQSEAESADSEFKFEIGTGNADAARRRVDGSSYDFRWIVFFITLKLYWVDSRNFSYVIKH